ncbi:DUF2442 domain-containing protein [Rufibacter sp. XAAS-G3-1]|uniref:DUF2442 domain-containing protein n=1 Tax=Rufibacter sp. XAAS-G3-1 TaxID=2729134 RepID=UPI0015E7D752|nr:DUF2442 domain-containing protein [Rufibacter sp. XAAS-G3-1]
MSEVIEFEILSNYHIWVKFNDGHEKVVNIRPLIGQGFTKELLEADNFCKVTIESGGGLEWHNGYDICPNFLRELPAEKKHVA